VAVQFGAKCAPIAVIPPHRGTVVPREAFWLASREAGDGS